MCILDIGICLYNWMNVAQVCFREDKEPPVQTWALGVKEGLWGRIGAVFSLWNPCFAFFLNAKLLSP